MRLRSHLGMGLMTDGKVLTKPFIKHTVIGCLKIECPSTVGKEGAKHLYVYSEGHQG